jgi:hypothetical protein
VIFGFTDHSGVCPHAAIAQIEKRILSRSLILSFPFLDQPHDIANIPKPMTAALRFWSSGL